jgi:membrane-anchored protein YejM (alkaline phosphatase superfamily)
LYGLGSENQNLPGFVVISPAQPAQGAPLWSSSFLPAAYQGTLVSDLKNPIPNLSNASLSRGQQRRQLDLLKHLNTLHQAQREEDSRLNARIESFELAFRMQTQAPEAFDLESESPETKKLYGIGDDATDIFGKQCLMARRLVERGVRIAQVYHTQTVKRSSCQLWDQHSELQKELPNNCAAVDKPIAGLLKDLKARGLLEDTLVIWGGEFGRTPTAEGTNGREHHPFGFTMWLAGGGVKGGIVHGATDEFGWHAVENKVHVHDLHATVLHLMGIDHTKLTYRYSGRDFRLTDVHGNVVRQILA